MKTTGTATPTGPTSVMEQAFSRLTPAGRARAGAEICAQLQKLLEIPPPPRGPTTGSWERFLEEVMVWLATEVDDSIRGLITIWASDREAPLSSVIVSLAEILLVERTERTEYVTSSGGAPPYVIGKLLLEYAVKARELDDIIGALTKSFCAESCDRLPVGCCSVLGYDLGLVPDRMLDAQLAEAAWRGWANRSDLERCRYHTPRGCTIALHKTPACLGFICADLEGMLAAEFGAEDVGEFLASLTELRRSDIDRRTVFEVLDRTIEAGSGLVSRR